MNEQTNLRGEFELKTEFALQTELAWRGPVLIVPGLNDSGAGHWQTLWEQRYPHFTRVCQDDWQTPDLDRWARRVVEMAVQAAAPVLVIAHSFGCLATVRAERFQSNLIAGALLVAPADPLRFGLDQAVSNVPLLFPSTVIASGNDPWISAARAAELSERWGSRLVTTQEGGHLNAQSGLGHWPAGWQQLDWLCRRMKPATGMMPAVAPQSRAMCAPLAA